MNMSLLTYCRRGSATAHVASATAHVASATAHVASLIVVFSHSDLSPVKLIASVYF